MSFANEYFNEVIDIANAIDKNKVEELVNALVKVRDVTDGRVFVLGVGGSAGNASHLVNDLRKLCGIEAYAPTDNVSELTARTNDEGFDTVFCEYLNISKFRHNDAIFILSVGGGDESRNVSVNLIDAIKEATKHLRGIEATDTGNILKYMWRWNNKNGIEDLRKARWYLNHLISHVEENQS